MFQRIGRHTLLLLFVSLPLLAAATSARADAGDAAKRAALVAAYPGLFAFEGNELVFAGGTRMIWDDGREKTPDELLIEPDLEDMFHYDYPLAAAGEVTPAQDSDPGRIRQEAFFKQLYGASSKQVQAQLTGLKWLPSLRGGTLQVTTVLGVAERLRAVSAEIEALPEKFHKYAVEPGGGFNWRVIAGTEQLSVHSFGAAVDINTEYADYWRWARAPEHGPIPYRNRIPLEIVAIFERHGFIWGGRWYHYDTMHFEYRPELILLSRTQ